VEPFQLVLAYCTGLICVCAIVLFAATLLTVRNYQLLRRLSEDTGAALRGASAPRAGRVDASRRLRVERYESAAPPEMGAGEWTGPVFPYTPADREPT
jgi:hypothetical protein